ncbi:MAG: protein TolA [Halieaceae bacterium]|nr:protein TolA [Halieaceae bacterium]
MTADRLLFIGFPTLLSLLLHIVVASLLFLRWSGPTEVVASVPVALPIQATIVRTETAKAASKPKPKAKPEPKPKSAEIPTTKPEPPPVAVTPQPKAADPTPAEEIALQMDAQQLAALTREELTSLIDAEQAASGSLEPSLRDVVAATIQAAVISRWTRPPSARNGMVSILSIQLVPTGEVVGVGVIQSSGNTAFDRSAVTAVERAGRFPEIAKVDNRTFEANFRRFQLIFKPEDLRY